MVIPSATAATNNTSITSSYTSTINTTTINTTTRTITSTLTTTTTTTTGTGTGTTGIAALKTQEEQQQQTNNALYTAQSTTPNINTTQLQPAPRQHPKKRKFDPAELDQHHDAIQQHHHHHHHHQQQQQQHQHQQQTSMDVVPAKSAAIVVAAVTSPLTLKNGSTTITHTTTTTTNIIVNSSNNSNNISSRSWISTLPIANSPSPTSASVTSYVVSTSSIPSTGHFVSASTTTTTTNDNITANTAAGIFAIRTRQPPMIISPVTVTTVGNSTCSSGRDAIIKR